MLILFFIALFVSFIVAFLLVRYESVHSHLSADFDTDSAQKFHTKSVPRIGGVAVFMGILFGFLFYYNTQAIWLLGALLPIFMMGLAEDLTKKISPNMRLVAAFIAAAIAIYTLDIRLISIGWADFDDALLSKPFLSIILTVFMLGGVAHATNIIDGFNGLLLGYATAALSIFLWIGLQVNDILVINISLITLGAILGLFIFNFPKAKIFSGDGGAYLIGFLLAFIALLLVKNNPQISPWMPLLIVIYPVFETLFSIYRRKILHNLDPTSADSQHLHSLIYKKNIPRHLPILVNKLGKNASTSVLIWLFVLPFMSPALIWQHSHFAMIVSIVVFCACYLYFYFAIK